MRKADLRIALREARSREADLEAMCSDAPADPSGKWLPKDHLAHMAYFRARDAQLIKAVSTGGDIPPKLPDGYSVVVYAENRDRPASEVVADARRAWDLLEDAVEGCSEEDFSKPRPYNPERKLIDGSPGDHLSAHLMWCHLDAGDEAAAEAVVRWAWDLSSRVATDSRSAAVGPYNVACFYARMGRVADALPLLRQSFEAAPDLKEWALKDPDLDPIRNDPRVGELLAAGVGASDAVG